MGERPGARKVRHAQNYGESAASGPSRRMDERFLWAEAIAGELGRCLTSHMKGVGRSARVAAPSTSSAGPPPPLRGGGSPAVTADATRGSSPVRSTGEGDHPKGG